MVVDCFIFYNELELLMFRLKELNDHVDYFVLVESKKTHSGNDKPLFFEENKYLFKDYLHKIVHVVDDYLPDNESTSGFKDLDDNSKESMSEFKKTPARIREEYQRNSISRGLNSLNLNDNDMIIISDADEIINPNIILKYRNSEFDMLALEQEFYFYNLNYKYPKIWTFPKVIKYKMLKQLTPEDIRLSTNGIRVENGGWHFSYFFGTQNIADKIRNFSHQEFNTDFYTNEKYIDECIKNGKYIFGDEKLEYIDIKDNNNLPKNYEILNCNKNKLFKINYEFLNSKKNTPIIKVYYTYLGEKDIKIKISIVDSIFKTVEIFHMVNVIKNVNYWSIFEPYDVHPFCNTHFTMGIDIIISNVESEEIIHNETIPGINYIGTTNTSPTFWVIGDSHVGNIFNTIDTKNLICGNYIIKHISHFLLSIRNFMKNDWKNFLKTIPIKDCDKISLFLGEIDMRIGILWQIKNIIDEESRKIKMIEIFDKFLNDYLNIIIDIQKLYPKCEIIILTPNGALRDNFENKDLICGTEDERLFLFKKFNSFFHDKNINYWNCIEEYLDDTGFIKKECLRLPGDHHVKDGEIFIENLKNKMNNKTVFLVTSYCDTEQKIEILNECIDNLKNISNNDICLHAHFPINNDIQKKVNYYLYDSSNPILKYPEKYITWWREYAIFKMNIYKDDYGYAVLQQWKRGFDFLKKLYDNVIIINYDVIISKKLLDQIENKSNLVGCTFLHENSNTITPLLSINTDSNLFNKISIDQYKNMNSFAENFAEYIFEGSNCYKFKFEEYKDDYYTMLDFDGNTKFKDNKLSSHSSPYDVMNFNDFEIFIGDKDDKLSFIFYNVMKDLSVKLLYNNIEIYSNNLNAYNWYLFNSDILFNKLDVNKLVVIVNEIELIIDKDIIKICKIT